MNWKAWLLTASLVSLAGYGTAAQAALSIVKSVGGGPKVGDVNYVNFDELALGDVPVDAVNNFTSADLGGKIHLVFSPSAKVVNVPNVEGEYAAPFLSGTNGLKFGPTLAGQVNGQDLTKYLTSGSTGNGGTDSVTITFDNPQKYFGLLWGSVDLYNTLSFYNGNTLVGAITGGMVDASAVGNQGSAGTFYVNIDSTLVFNKVVATSSNFAFEFDNVAYSSTPLSLSAVPEPASLIVWLLLGLAGGVGALIRCRKSA